VERDGQALQIVPARAECAVADPQREAVGDHTRQCLGRGVRAGQAGILVEVAVGQLPEHLVQHARGGADVDDDAVAVQLGPAEAGVDDVGRAVQPLGRAEHLPGEAVGDHHGVANRHAEHGDSAS
jgi:hypothetical protein